MPRRPQLVRSLAVAYIILGSSTSSIAAPKSSPAKSTSPNRKPAARPSASKRPATHPKYNPRHHSSASFPADVESTPAYRYAQLDAASCYAELEQRRLPAQREEQSWPGITQPMRLTGPLNGITWRTDILETERSTSPYELFDCRLLLALDDFTKLLRTEGIDQVVFSSAYRPPPKSVATDEQARRHSGGLAIDVHRLHHEDGHWVKVDQDFHGRIGAKVCLKSNAAKGTAAPAAVPTQPKSATTAKPSNASTTPTGLVASRPTPPSSSIEANRLRRIVCGAATQRLFQSILTPNYDYPHRNHFHLELTVGVRWFIVS